MYFIPPNPGNNPANPFYYRTMEEQRRELDKQVEGSSEGDIQEEQPGITAERQKDKMFSKPKPSKRAVLDDKKDDEKKDDEKKDDEKKDDEEKKGKPKGKPKGPKGPRPGVGGLGPRPKIGGPPGGPYNPGGRGGR